MPPRTMTILFTDIVGSVKMYTKVSDSVAVDVVKNLERQVQDALAPHKGKFIKSTGDGHLCIFEEPSGAVRTARTIHGLCDNLARAHMQDLAVRIAVHTGEAVEEGGDIHGQAVNLTARILSVTGACETCVTADTWSKLGAEDRQGFVPHGPEVFKGFTRYTYIYKKPNPNPLTDVTFRPESMADEDSTLLVTDTMPKHARYALLIEHPQVTKTVVLSEGETHVLGRAPECHTQIPDRMFSSTHAAFSVVDGILWCFDLQSSNGVVYRGRRLKRRKPIETNSMVQLPTGLVQIKLPT
ncbi:MAG TPA: adenylate/guanylate cyclase domain-containing protein [Planctomycetota bacterium]|nr:adenylate/guanylate cyclase domain-containing protein [Planctomycetota bacterium]